MQCKHATFGGAYTQAQAFIKGRKSAQERGLVDSDDSPLLQIVESRGDFYLETDEDAGLMIRVGEFVHWLHDSEGAKFYDEMYEKNFA